MKIKSQEIINQYPYLIAIIIAFGVGFHCGLGEAEAEMSEIQCEICSISETKPSNAEKAQYCELLMPENARK